MNIHTTYTYMMKKAEEQRDTWDPDALAAGLVPCSAPLGALLLRKGFIYQKPALAAAGAAVFGHPIGYAAKEIARIAKASKKVQLLTYALTAIPASAGLGTAAYIMADRK